MTAPPGVDPATGRPLGGGGGGGGAAQEDPPEHPDYGPATDTEVDGAGTTPAPSTELPIEGGDMDGFAAQWGEFSYALDPIFAALARCSAELSTLLAFPWEGDAGDAARRTARTLKDAIDELLAIGQEGGLADLLQTANAQRNYWHAQARAFEKAEIVKWVLLGVEVVAAIASVALGPVLGAVTRAVGTVATRIGGAIASRAGAVATRVGSGGAAVGTGGVAAGTAGAGGTSVGGLFGQAAAAVAGLVGPRAGSVITNTVLVGVFEYAIALAANSIYRKVVLEDSGLDPEYGEGALTALAAPAAAAVFLARLFRNVDGLAQRYGLTADVLFNAANGFIQAFLGSVIAERGTGGLDASVLLGAAAGGSAGALGNAGRRVDEWFRGKLGDPTYAAALQARLDEEGIPEIGASLFGLTARPNAAPAELTAVRADKQADYERLDQQNRNGDGAVELNRDADELDAVAATARAEQAEQQATADAYTARIAQERASGRDPEVVEETVQGLTATRDAAAAAAAAAGSRAAAATRQAEAKRDGAVTLLGGEAALAGGPDGRTTAGATAIRDDAAAKVDDAALDLGFARIAEEKGPQTVWAAIAIGRRYGAVHEWAYQVPISLTTKLWATVALSELTDSTAADQLAERALERLRALGGTPRPGVDVPPLEEIPAG